MSFTQMLLRANVTSLPPKWRHFCPASLPPEWHHILLSSGITYICKKNYLYLNWLTENCLVMANLMCEPSQLFTYPTLMLIFQGSIIGYAKDYLPKFRPVWALGLGLEYRLNSLSGMNTLAHFSYSKYTKKKRFMTWNIRLGLEWETT